MQVFDDGSLYIEKGDQFPMKCPSCAALIPYRDGLSVTCDKCGHEDCAEEFCKASFTVAPLQ